MGCQHCKKTPFKDPIFKARLMITPAGNIHRQCVTCSSYEPGPFDENYSNRLQGRAVLEEAEKIRDLDRRLEEIQGRLARLGVSWSGRQDA